jgi:hypothetical protein
MRICTIAKLIRHQPLLELAAFWQIRVRTLHEVTKPLTARQLKQLQLLRVSLGDHPTIDVIDWAMDNWRPFVRETRMRTGWVSAPPIPHIGFLFAHRHLAVFLMDEDLHKMLDNQN